MQMTLALDIPEFELLPLEAYDKILVGASAGKDSSACLLHLLEIGVPPQKLELWHHRVDDGEAMYDWPCTDSYVTRLGELFQIPVYFQYREGGIYGEMLRENRLTNDVIYEDENKNLVRLQTMRGKLSTRMKFPAITASLQTRWCSASAKIDVMRRVVNNDPRLQGTPGEPMKILVVTGERWEESKQRSTYLEAEIHPCNSKNRIVHWWRPVISWSEKDIWDIHRRWNLRPSPVYYLGFSRMSCMGCIFSTPDLWAIIRHIAPERFEKFVAVEKGINHTMDPKMTLTQKADRGCLDRLPKDPRVTEWIAMALSHDLRKEDLIMEQWELPAGAFRGAEGGAP